MNIPIVSNPIQAVQTSPKLIKVESLHKSCCCCLAENDLKKLLSTHYYQGKQEIYADMLVYCFSIQLLSEDLIYNVDNLNICGSCIDRLREAHYFKSQIESVQESLRKISAVPVENNDIKHELFENCSDSNFSEIGDTLPTNEILVKEMQNLKKKSKKCKSKKGNCSKAKKLVTKNEYKLKLENSLNNSDESDGTGVIKYTFENSDKASSLKANKIGKPVYTLNKDALTCKICDETFPLHNSLVRHMPIHFPEHICHICAKIFQCKSKLRGHIKRHLNQTDQTCEICNKTYKGLDNLKIHMREHTKPGSIYKCPHCSERFSGYYKRVKHLIDVHNDEPRKYKCKQCPKRYFQACTLTTHIKRVHLQERSCICSECGDAFYDKTGLSDHMLKHSGIKSFKCNICQKSYGRMYTLNVHMRSHTNDKRFVCSVCGKAFTQKCTLKTHSKIHEKSQFSLE